MICVDHRGILAEGKGGIEKEEFSLAWIIFIYCIFTEYFFLVVLKISQ